MDGLSAALMAQLAGRIVDAEHLDAVASLCSRSLVDSPTREELQFMLFEVEPVAQVWGDPEVGVAAVAVHPAGAFLRLLVVDGEHRRRGYGKELLAWAESAARNAGAPWLHVGSEAPWYLWPGIDTTELGLLCLLDQAKYDRVDSAWNMGVDLATFDGDLTRDGEGARVAVAADRVAVQDWTAKHWAHWAPEMLRALDRGTLVVSHDDEGITAACAYGASRERFLGPVAVRPDLMGSGAGQAVLVRALQEMRDAGLDRAEIAWVGPIRPYVQVGAMVDRIFSVQKKRFT